MSPLALWGLSSLAGHARGTTVQPAARFARPTLGDYSFPCHALDRCTARAAGGMIVSDHDASGRVRLKLLLVGMATTFGVGAVRVGVAQRPGSKHWADGDSRVRAGGDRTGGER